MRCTGKWAANAEGKAQVAARTISTALTLVLVLSLFTSGTPTRGHEPDSSNELTNSSTIHEANLAGRYFIENRGQVDDAVRYYSTGNPSIAFREDGVMFVLREETERQSSNHQGMRDPAGYASSVIDAHEGIRSLAFFVRFEGANAVTPVGEDELDFNNNFFIGNDPSKWRTDVPSFSAVVYRNIYDGIDLTYRSSPLGVKYDLVVHPGANAGMVRMTYEGVESLRLDGGNLVVHTALGDISDSTPYSYEKAGNHVRCSFLLRDIFSYGFACGPHDGSKTLVIDPLIYSTFLGGCFSDSATSIAIDSGGNAYVTGITSSWNFSVTPGAYMMLFNGQFDAFVTKLNPLGSSLVYSTYVGGVDYEEGASIAVDFEGNAYITGSTYSVDFPITPNAFDRTINVSDAFVTKLNQNGNKLVYSTFIGGDIGNEWATSIAVDASGSAYVTGGTTSTDFPTTPGAYHPSPFGGYGDAFVTKLNPGGTALVYSTYLGGTRSSEVAASITVDVAGSAYVTGWTRSQDFPTTAGAYDITQNGGTCVPPRLGPCPDAFAVKLDADGRTLVYGTFLGGPYVDSGNSIAVDTSGNAYVAGLTNATDFPVTAGALGTALNGPWDGFVTKLNAAGSTLVYSTFVGGSGYDEVRSVVVDNLGHAYISGNTDSTDFTVTADAFDSTYEGDQDVVVAELNPAGSAFDYSTYFGGNKTDSGTAIAADFIGNVYVAGETYSANFPVTKGAFDTYRDTEDDAFVLRLKLGTLTNLPDLSISQSDIDFFPPRPVIANTNVTINATVHNIGDKNASQVIVKFYDGFPSPSRQIDGNQTIPFVLPFGGTGVVSVPWSVGPPGQYLICVSVDPDNNISESNEGNNIACLGITALLPVPDLVIFPGDVALSPLPPYTEGDAVRVDATIRNFGGNVSGATVAIFHDGTPPSPQIGTDQPLPPIPVNEVASVSVTWTASVPGTHDLCVVADPDNVVAELDESNNMICVNVLVQPVPPTRPDYVPVNTSPPTPTKVGLSLLVRLSMQVQNTGETTPTTGTTLAFFNSSTPSSPFHVYDIPAISGGETIGPYAANWTSPAAPGTYLVMAQADQFDYVAESNESNNVYTWTFNVVSGPTTSLIVGAPNYTAADTHVKSSAQLSFSVIDLNGVGIRNTTYRTDGWNWINYTATGPFTLAGKVDGLHLVEWRSEDYAGNVEAIVSKVLIIDDTPPITTIDPPSGEFTNETLFTLGASDSGCGVDITEYRIDGGSWRTYSSGFNLSEGDHNISYRSMDNLGNLENEKYLDVTVHGPSVPPPPPPAAETNYKPLVATVFTIILAVVGFWSSRKRPWKGGTGGMAVMKAFLLTSVLFVAAESVTGVVSLLTGVLSVPPLAGLGTVVDLAILLSGLSVAVLRARSRAQRSPDSS